MIRNPGAYKTLSQGITEHPVKINKSQHRCLTLQIIHGHIIQSRCPLRTESELLFSGPDRNMQEKIEKELILAGDIGGTNANFAIVQRSNEGFTILRETVVPSDTIDDFTRTSSKAAASLTGKSETIARCCICAAGAVKDNSCTMTNQSWKVDGTAIGSALEVPTIVINDFLALSYSLPLLNVHNPEQIMPLPHTDGSLPEPRGGSYAVIGAGTGLGVAHLIHTGSGYVAVPSEGGHVDFPAYDAETRELAEFLTRKYAGWPGTECVLSGQGISNIYDWIRTTVSGTGDEILQKIDQLPPKKRPALISKNADTNLHCGRVMQLFTRIYGQFAGNTSLNFLPEAGLFLAGGIAQKNIGHLLKENSFMKYFENNYNPKMKEIQHRIPVYLIKDYSVSLLGAAHAAAILTP